MSWKPPTRHEEADEFIAIVDLDAFDMALARIERLDILAIGADCQVVAHQ
jgi:uncharacterized OB-fold protein